MLKKMKKRIIAAASKWSGCQTPCAICHIEEAIPASVPTEISVSMSGAPRKSAGIPPR